MRARANVPPEPNIDAFRRNSMRTSICNVCGSNRLQRTSDGVGGSDPPCRPGTLPRQTSLPFPPGCSYSFSAPSRFEYPPSLIEAQELEIHLRWARSTDVPMHQFVLFPVHVPEDDLFDLDFLNKIVALTSRSGIGDWRRGAFAVHLVQGASSESRRKVSKGVRNSPSRS